MKFNSNFILFLEKDLELYEKLLGEEDFDFRSKNIDVVVSRNSDSLKVDVSANSLIDLKIGVSAVIKSLEVIEKSLKI